MPFSNESFYEVGGSIEGFDEFFVINQQLLTEITPWAEKLGIEGQAGLYALDYLDLSANE